MAPPVLLTIFKFIYLQVYYLKSGEVTSLYLMKCSRLDVYIKMQWCVIVIKLQVL